MTYFIPAIPQSQALRGLHCTDWIDNPITYAFPTAEQATLPEVPLFPLGEDIGVPSSIGTPASVILRLWQE